jgi:hypothetical protein
MRHLASLACLCFASLLLVACGGGSRKSNMKVTFGQRGGTVPWAVTISPNGATARTVYAPMMPKALTSAQEADLSRLVRGYYPNIKSEHCARPGYNSREWFVTALGRTVTVKGNCQPIFFSFWVKLLKASHYIPPVH